eukprot:CAMPEP_0170598616 /NCGR_PEP_ID=MMETSP0224-20130122/16345_1 /TAXON_ID=285029 /ORGANISM="Togula jolla, Strain CCCM 725" /LENGTH=107 /DNA_ID=CAMNT_0010923185 /DNA_START=108 /DNA_END=431 /DNA_ORIENTATION=+
MTLAGMTEINIAFLVSAYVTVLLTLIWLVSRSVGVTAKQVNKVPSTFEDCEEGVDAAESQAGAALEVSSPCLCKEPTFKNRVPAVISPGLAILEHYGVFGAPSGSWS